MKKLTFIFSALWQMIQAKHIYLKYHMINGQTIWHKRIYFQNRHFYQIPSPPGLVLKQGIVREGIDVQWNWIFCKIERKAVIRNRYNYPTPPIRDIKGKETQTRNNWTLMEISLAESQTDSYFPTKWTNGYPKPNDVSDIHIQRRTITTTKKKKKKKKKRGA